MRLVRLDRPFSIWRCTSTSTRRSVGLRWLAVKQPRPSAELAAAKTAATPDWSAVQYLKFGNERTRAAHDLIARIPPPSHQQLTGASFRIIDLGCGPGNSTAALLERFPGANVVGVDSSPDMLARAGRDLPGTRFIQADVRTWGLSAPFPGLNKKQDGPTSLRSSPPEPLAPADLLFSNALFHWLRQRDRIPTIARLLRSDTVLRPGGVLAFQVPDNHDEPSHVAMRETAAQPGSAWADMFLEKAGSGDEERPDVDSIEAPVDFYDALAPHCDSVDMWHTLYRHVLEGPRDIVEWVRGSGLQPFLNALPDDGGMREAFLDAYERRLAEVYPRLGDGRVMLTYPRLFVVAVKRSA